MYEACKSMWEKMTCEKLLWNLELSGMFTFSQHKCWWPFLLFVTGRKARMIIIFVGVGLSLVRRQGATLCTDYREIWYGGGGRQYLTHCQSWKFSGFIWGIPAQKTLQKCVITLKCQTKILFSPHVDESLGQKLLNLLRQCYYMVYICVLFLIRFGS